MEDSKTLQIEARPGVSQARLLADLATDGIATNAIIASTFLAQSLPETSLTEMVASLHNHGRRVSANDLSAAEQMLTAQAVALNAIFAEMARRSALNMGQHLDATEKYMRLALKAQGQSRATVETLAAIKNPPVIFARQTNIAHGPQQVNNGVALERHQRAATSAHAHGQSGIKTNELLGADDGERMDTAAQGTAGDANSGVAAVGTLNRANVSRGARNGGAKQL